MKYTIIGILLAVLMILAIVGIMTLSKLYPIIGVIFGWFILVVILFLGLAIVNLLRMYNEEY